MEPEASSEDDLPIHLPSNTQKGIAARGVSNDTQSGLLPLCWFLLIAIVTWSFIALVATFLIVWHTQNPLHVSVFAPFESPAYLFYRILKSFAPMNEHRFLIAKMKIEMLSQIKLLGKRDKKGE